LTFIVKRGSFAKATGGAPVSQTIDTLSGEEIKFLRVWTERQVGTGFADGDIGHSEGWSDGTNEGCFSIGVEDNVGTSDAARRQALKLLSCVDHDQTLAYEGVITSFGSGIDAGKFTVNWTTNNGLADEIYYEAFCGAKIKNVKIGVFDSAVVTGNQSITGVGFQGNYLNVWSIGKTMTAPATFNDASYSVGDAVSDSKRNGIAMYVDEGVVNTITTQTDLLIRTLAFAGMGGGAEILEDLDFVSFDPDGWTHNLIVAKSKLILYGFLMVEFEDVEVDIGDFLEPVANSTINVPTSNKSVQEIKIRSQSRTATISIINDGIVKQIIGAGTYANLSQGTTGFFYDHSGGTSDNENSGDQARIIRLFEAQTTLVGDAQLTTQTVVTDFRLIWTNTDGTAREILFTAFSFVFKNQEFDVDAFLQAKFDNDFTVDAFLKATQDNDFDVDAFLQATQDNDFLVDACLSISKDLDFNVDAIPVNRFDDDSNVDGILLGTIDEDFDVDANVQLATSDSFEADAFLQKTDTHTFEVDAFPEATQEDTSEVDAIVLLTDEDESEVDAVVVERFDFDFNVDAVVVERFTFDFNVDAITINEKTHLFDVDSLIEQETDEDFNVDAIVVARNNQTFQVDGNVELIQDLEFEVDANVQDMPSISFEVDANTEGTQEHEFEVDALVETTEEAEAEVDAVVVDRLDLDFDLDSIIITPSSDSFEIDGVLQAKGANQGRCGDPIYF